MNKSNSPILQNHPLDHPLENNTCLRFPEPVPDQLPAAAQFRKISGGSQGAFQQRTRYGVLAAICDYGSGYKYDINQDACMTFNTPSGTYLFSVDGVGGQGGGERASAAIISGFKRTLAETSNIKQLFELASRSVMGHYRWLLRNQPESAQTCKDMAACAVGVHILKTRASFQNIGDSAGLLIRDSRIIYATPMHNAAVEMYAGDLKKGRISEEQLLRMPNRNEVTRIIGIVDGRFLSNDKPQGDSRKLKFGDRIILASDGLWDVLTSAAVLKITNQFDDVADIACSLRERVRTLIEFEPERDDNINIIVYEHMNKPR